MNVLKCDICGEVYSKPEASHKHGCVIVYGEVTYDTCPKCTQKLEDFIDVLKNYSDNYKIEITSTNDWFELPKIERGKL